MTPSAPPVTPRRGGLGAEPQPGSPHVGGVWSAPPPLPGGCHIPGSRSGRLRRGLRDALLAVRSQSPALSPRGSQVNTHLGRDAALREASSPDPAGRRPLGAPAGRAGLAPYVSRETGSALAARLRSPPGPALPIRSHPSPPRSCSPRPVGPAGQKERGEDARARNPFFAVG